MEARTQSKARAQIVATKIRIYVEATPDAPPHRHDFNLADFGGQLPEQGDLIMDPMAPRSAEGAQVWEVIARYHDPGRGFDAQAVVRIQARARAATVAEAALFADH